MYLLMYVCTCLSVCLYVCMYVHVCLSVCMYMSVCMYVHVCLSVCMSVCLLSVEKPLVELGNSSEKFGWNSKPPPKVSGSSWVPSPSQNLTLTLNGPPKLTLTPIFNLTPTKPKAKMHDPQKSLGPLPNLLQFSWYPLSTQTCIDFLSSVWLLFAVQCAGLC